MKTIKSAFEINFDLQAKRFVQTRHVKNLRKLTTFYFKRHEKFNLPDTYLKKLEQLVQKRGRKRSFEILSGKKFGYEKHRAISHGTTRKISRS